MNSRYDVCVEMDKKREFGKELKRKILHLLAMSAAIVWLYALDNCFRSVLTAFVFGLIMLPVFLLLSKIPGLTEHFVARKKGEFGLNFAAYIITYCVTALFLWGLLGHRDLVATAILAWGPGDAAAALVGKSLGKHKIGRSKKKSLEGSMAMFTVAFLAVFISLLIFGIFPPAVAAAAAILTAAVSATVELYVENGYDTFYCPVSASVVLAAFALIFAR